MTSRPRRRSAPRPERWSGTLAPPDPPPREAKAIHGVPWTLLGYASNRGITMVTTIALARLLAPSDFGLATMAGLVMTVIIVFTSSGLGNALVARQDLGRRSQGTVFTLLLGLGLIGALGGTAAAPLIARAFGEPRLQSVFAVAAAIIAFAGVTSFYDAVLRREMALKRQFICQLMQAVTYAPVALTLAVMGAGVWSLVVAQVVGFGVLAGSSFALAPYRVRPAWDWAVARDFASKARGFLLQAALGFISSSVDYMIVGRVAGARSLGLYSVAYRLGTLPYQAISEPLATRIAFPSFSRMQHEGADVKPAYLRFVQLLALVTCPLGVLLSATAHPFTEVVLGDKWLPMVGALSILGLSGAVLPVQNGLATMFNAVGLQMLTAIRTGVVLLLAVPALALAAKSGITAVAWVMFTKEALSCTALMAIAGRRTGVKLRDHWSTLRPVVLGGAVMWGGARLTAGALDGAPAGLDLLAAAAVGVVVYVAAVWVLAPSLPRLAIAQVREIVGGLRSSTPPPVAAGTAS